MAAEIVVAGGYERFVRVIEGIDINKQDQTLVIDGKILAPAAALVAADQQQEQQQQEQQQPAIICLFQDLIYIGSRGMRYIVNLLQEHPHAVESLDIRSMNFTQPALDILENYFINMNTTTTTTTTMSSSSSLRHISFERLDLGNEDGGRLLSALHNNTFVTQLGLYKVGLEGRTGGTIISNLLQHNRCLTTLYCLSNQFGARGAQAMKPGIRGNSTLKIIDLGFSQLGDEGIAHIADAFLLDHDGNNNTTTAVTHLSLRGNGITANSLPIVTQLIQHPNLRVFSIDHNPHLFDNQDDFQRFLIALQTSTVNNLSMGHCLLSVHQMIEIFETLLLTTTPIRSIDVYDNDQLQHGTELERLLDIIPQLQTFWLCVNLDFTDSSVLSSFHRNTDIQKLHRHIDGKLVEITDGNVFDIF